MSLLFEAQGRSSKWTEPCQEPNQKCIKQPCIIHTLLLRNPQTTRSKHQLWTSSLGCALFRFLTRDCLLYLDPVIELKYHLFLGHSYLFHDHNGRTHFSEWSNTPKSAKWSKTALSGLQHATLFNLFFLSRNLCWTNEMRPAVEDCWIFCQLFHLQGWTEILNFPNYSLINKLKAY